MKAYDECKKEEKCQIIKCEDSYKECQLFQTGTSGNASQPDLDDSFNNKNGTNVVEEEAKKIECKKMPKRDCWASTKDFENGQVQAKNLLSKV